MLTDNIKWSLEELQLKWLLIDKDMDKSSDTAAPYLSLAYSSFQWKEIEGSEWWQDSIELVLVKEPPTFNSDIQARLVAREQFYQKNRLLLLKLLKKMTSVTNPYADDYRGRGGKNTRFKLAGDTIFGEYGGNQYHSDENHNWRLSVRFDILSKARSC